MASYHTRQREPLLDGKMQAIMERRGREMIGLALLGAAVILALILMSYAPSDPSWMSATDAPVRNALGLVGAAVAAPLMIIAGYGSWGVPLILAIWGGRLMTHRGEERTLSRIIFMPIAVAMASVYAATLAPGAGWTHPFGMGGLFGDTVLGALLGVAPVGLLLGLKLLSVVFAVLMLGSIGYAGGYDRDETRAMGRFVLMGLVLVYAGLASTARAGLFAVLRGAQAALDWQRDRRKRRDAVAAALTGDDMHGPARRSPVIRAEGALRVPSRAAQTAAMHGAAPLDAAERSGETASRAEPPLRFRSARHDGPMGQATASAAEGPGLAPARPRSGLLGLVPGLMKRAMPGPVAPEPELVTPALAPDAEAPGEDRIRARISDAIRARVRGGPLQPAPRRPDAGQTAALPPEPPLMRKTEPQDAPLFERGEGEGPCAADDAALFDWDEAEDTYGAPAAPALPEARRPVVENTPRRAAPPSRQARAEAQPRLPLEPVAPQAYEPPPLTLLTNPAQVQRMPLSDEALEENARMLESVLDDYGVKGEIVSVRPGPVVTMYELEPAPGLKASRVIGLADDIARSMSALSARVSTVPGRSVIGIELPNENREKVVLREILSARGFGDSAMRLPLALGKDIGGEPIVANLAKMPHLLIAGTTGSGKSVAINTMILSLLYKLSPEECRMIMIDPKMLELSVYDGIPHLLSPVVTDPKKAVVALKWVVAEMEDRYRKMSKMGVRNIEGYNGRVREALARGEMFKRTVQTGFDDETGDPVFETEEFAPEAIPFIVVVVDEMADLMMVAGKEIEACIQRLAQMARASGIHLIMATQRPSVDVITGTIKANFPTRISFQVTSKIDSRTILGEQGAEQLLGMGDMLYMAGGARITRIHGPFVSDEEVEEIVTHLKSFGPPAYKSGVLDGPDEDSAADIDAVLGLGGSGDGGDDALYDQAVAIVAKDRKCSTSYIQRKLAIGYNKAARLVEQMEDQGIVTPANHVGKRDILVPEHG
jgi:S-DNA-T family DNA segregation ATPase FtsK/SpoIIIE